MKKKTPGERKENLKCYEIILNYNCNARCLFCSQGSFDKRLNASFESIAENIYRAYAAGYRRIGFTGGEPLLRPDIVKIISLAKKVGFGFIRIQTNGILLSSGKFCERLVRAGLTFCKFSFLSDNAEVHDKLLVYKGAWKQAMRGLENLKIWKIRLGTNILVNRYNYNRLPEIIHFFLKNGISNFVIIYPLYIGNMKKNSDKLKISLPDVQKYFRDSINLMERVGLSNEILFLNVPPCFIRGRESLSIGLDRFNTLVTDPEGIKTDLDLSSNENKKRVKACFECAYFARCGGVDFNYLQVFGEEGFNPVKETFKTPGKPIKEVFLSDNERCLLEVLRIQSPASTKEVLKIAGGITLCRDCSDGNAVINAGESLIRKNRVEKFFKKGKYFWRIK